MGSYLIMNGEELNSKSLSGIVIDAIRDLDDQIMSTEHSTKKDKKLFVPEYYKKDIKKLGCGNWKIHRRGVALLCSYLKQLKSNDTLLLAFAIENDWVESAETNVPQDFKDDVERCLYFVSGVLADLVIEGKKKTKVTWS